MNDIGAKSEESTKILAEDVGDFPLVDKTVQDEVDPLAASENDVEYLKEPIEASEPEADVFEKQELTEVDVCDENTKENTGTKCEVVNDVKTLDIESKRIREELLKDDNSSIDSTLDDNLQTIEACDESIESIVIKESSIEKKVPSVERKLTPIAEVTKLQGIAVKTAEEINVEESLKTSTEIVSKTDQIVQEKPIESKSQESESSSPKNIILLPKTEILLKENIELTIPAARVQPTEDKETVIAPQEIIKEKNFTTCLNVKANDKENKKVSQEDKMQEKSHVEKIKEEFNIERIKVISDVEMKELPQEIKVEKNIGPVESAKSSTPPVNGENTKEDQPLKRPSNEETDTESPLKRLCQEVERNFPQHDSMMNDYIQNATKNNVDDIQRHTEQLLSEIQTLRELAKKKELEWNNILHLKKVKEEILLRLLRKKQVISFEKSGEVNGKEPCDYLNSSKNLAIDKSDEISGLMLKPPTTINQPMIQPPMMPVTSHFNPMSGLPPPYDKAAHMGMPKVFPQNLMMPGPTMPFPRELNGQMPNFALPMGRQGPTKDVKSIIADYRQRNPDVTPRRGRRMKPLINPNMMNAPRQIAPKLDMNNLGSLNNLGMIFNNLDMNQKAMLERLSQMQGTSLPNGMSFKDVLVQFANIQQQTAGLIPPNRPEMMVHRPEVPVRPESRRRPERPHHEEVHTSKSDRVATSSPRLPPPPPYPEISLLPVSNNQENSPQNSLLHGILTKQVSPASQSYSPTLAKLLTSPERKQKATLPTFGQAKNCGEITITPVQPTPTPPQEVPVEKSEVVVQLDEEESHQSGESTEETESSRRLVIDEGEAEAPPCQGCRRRAAQFVCAGCANQWYCSRDCQVAAWDEHSEMCSG